MKHYKFLIIAFIMVSFISCNDNNNVETNESKNVLSLVGGITGIPNVDDFINYYDQSDVIGIVLLESRKLDVSFNGNTHSGMELNGSAIFANNTRTEKVSAGQSIIINGIPLVESSAGVYRNSTEYALVLNYVSNNNKAVIEGSSAIPTDSSTFQIPSPITITNISLNQNISKSSNLVINWTGGATNQLAQLRVITSDGSNLPVGSVAGIYRMYSNHNNTLTLSSSDLNSLVNGNNKLELMTYYPIYRTLSNGKKVCYISKYVHEITVNITN